MNWKDVPVPPFLAERPRDKRGFPIPASATVTDGFIAFDVIDEPNRQHLIKHELCGLCGKKLFRGKFFVGGPKSAFAQNGLYVDPPMHRDCAEYALKVCPYLALSTYRPGKLDASRVKKVGLGVVIDTNMEPDRPPVFVMIGVPSVRHIAGWFNGHKIVKYLEPRGSWIDATFWRHGGQISYEDALSDIERQLSDIESGRRSFDSRRWSKCPAGSERPTAVARS